MRNIEHGEEKTLLDKLCCEIMFIEKESYVVWLAWVEIENYGMKDVFEIETKEIYELIEEESCIIWLGIVRTESM